jgi:hypothetical protein
VVEHNTIMQSGNVITAYGGTRETPSAAERFVFRDNIALHNANGVIGQSLAVGNDTLARFFPGAIFMRNVLAGGVAARYPADNLFPTVDSLSQQFQDPGSRDYRLRPTSSLRSVATDARDLGVSYTELVRAMDPQAGSSQGPQPDGDSSGRPRDRTRSGPPAYIR